jgi:hypothetical protein
MAEPLFMLADIEISASALGRWLKSKPLPAAAFSDWPDAIFREDSGISQVPEPERLSVADELVAYCADSIRMGDGFLHCQYDGAEKALHAAACFRYGDEPGVMEYAVFLCALLRGIGDVYTAKKSSFIRLLDGGSDLLCIEIGKRSSRVAPDSMPAPLPPSWFGAWVSQDNLSDPDIVAATLLPPLARALKKQIKQVLGVLHATAQKPYRYDCFFITDGERVFRFPYDVPVPDADPKTFHRVTPANQMDSAFYADARRVWYYDYNGEAVFVQELTAGTTMKGWRPFGSDGEPLLRCGDTVWSTACMDYPKGESASSYFGYLKRGDTRKNVESVLRVIESQGGIPVSKKPHFYDYLRPVQVDEASFFNVKDCLFEDKKSVYVQTREGLIRIEGAIPGATTEVGELRCINGRVFRYGYEIPAVFDAAALRHIGGDVYADSRHVYRLSAGSAEGRFLPAPDIFQDADPMTFRVMRRMMYVTLYADAQRVWLDTSLVPGLAPEAVKLMNAFFWTDGNRVYFDGTPIPEASPEKFEVLGDFHAHSRYARQGGTVFFDAHPIPGADAASFVIDGSYSHMAHDKYRQYHDGKALES